MTAADLFRQAYSREPAGLFSAPGRVNLIGEHTDYSGGLVLPFAIDARANLAAAPNDDQVVRVTSAQRPGEQVVLPLAEIAPSSSISRLWAGYPAGAVWALNKLSPVGGFDLALDSQVPAGAGLSSSAAVECVTVLAVSTLSGIDVDARTIARLAQQAENDFVGVPCGPMDQTASAAAQRGSVLLFDTRADTIEHIPFDPAAEGLAVLVIDTRVAHSLADGEYAKRRSSCERAAELLGVGQLRDIDPADLRTALAKLNDDELRRRVRHVVTENERVESTVRLLRSAKVSDIGGLLTASHRSLQHDYQVSCDELDQAVESALGAGALGARMTGGGFGGSVIALLPESSVDAAVTAVRDDFASRGFTPPVPRIVSPAQGARRDG
ncbi:MAG: galactokinase [Nakamurella sp.]